MRTKRRRKNVKRFNPTKAFCDKKINEWILAGGQITKLVVDKDTPISIFNYSNPVDSFLRG